MNMVHPTATFLNLPQEIQVEFLKEYGGDEWRKVIKIFAESYEGAFDSAEALAASRDMTLEEWQHDRESQREDNCPIFVSYYEDKQGKVHLFIFA